MLFIKSTCIIFLLSLRIVSHIPFVVVFLRTKAWLDLAESSLLSSKSPWEKPYKMAGPSARLGSQEEGQARGGQAVRMCRAARGPSCESSGLFLSAHLLGAGRTERPFQMLQVVFVAELSRRHRSSSYGAGDNTR